MEKLFDRRAGADELVSSSFARIVCELSGELGRRLGLLVDRRGRISRVVVGDAKRIDLGKLAPDATGPIRLTGQRLIATQLRESAPLGEDELAALVRKRFDAVVVVAARGDTAPVVVRYAHLLPPEAGGVAQSELGGPVELGRLDFDFPGWVRAFEQESARKRERARKQGESGERAILVAVGPESAATVREHLDELRELARAAGVEVAGEAIQRRAARDPKYVTGKGKLDEIVLTALSEGATMLIFDCELAPSQIRSIADATALKVIDRVMLILDIFAKRAKSRDGKLQVELAQLKYRMPRLAEMNTAMSRLTGGIGGRGPGETKLEINRRRAKDRVTLLERELERLAERRELRRRQRGRQAVPTVAIAGYTNVGKSTLLNRLTGADALAMDQLFATLDTTSRRLHFGPKSVVLTDTVGFIRDLPKDLLNAFKATLEEVAAADAILLLRDASDPTWKTKAEAVDRILDELGCGDIPRMVVFNKIDRIELAAQLRLRLEAPGALLVSAVNGDGLEALRERLSRLAVADSDPPPALEPPTETPDELASLA